MFLPIHRKKKKTIVNVNKKRDPLLPSIENIKYEDVCDMPVMHAAYIKQTICRNGKWIPENELPLTLLKCAIEGAYVTITDAKQSSYIGIQGVLLMETKFTFVIINQKNKVVVLKKNTKLVFTVIYREEEYSAVIYGNAIVNRLFNKKYKSKNTIEFTE